MFELDLIKMCVLLGGHPVYGLTANYRTDNVSWVGMVSSNKEKEKYPKYNIQV